MRYILIAVIMMLAIAGCGPHRVNVEPVKIEPIQLTLDINVKVQQEQIEEFAAKLSPVIGKSAPDFTLPDQDKISFTLSEVKDRWIVLYFYPKNNTPGCTIEAKEFTSLTQQFKSLNSLVVGISEDIPESHCNFIDEYKLSVRLLSDPEHKIMKLYGAWVVSSLGEWSYSRVIRTTMIIDPNGIIRYYWPEVIAQGHAERVLKKLAYLQGIKLKTD